MFGFLIGGARAIAAAAAITLFAAAPAWAQPTQVEAPSSESLALGTEMAHILMQDIDYKAVLGQSMGALDHTFDEFKDRPEWPDLFKQALVEEIDQDRPAFDRVVGRAFAKFFTLDELRAGVDFLHGPGGPALAKVVAEGATGDKAPSLPPEVTALIVAAMQTPAGASFFDKFGKIGPVMDSVQTDMVAAFLPGVFRRFGEKAAAAEDARNAAQ